MEIKWRGWVGEDMTFVVVELEQLRGGQMGRASWVSSNHGTVGLDMARPIRTSHERACTARHAQCHAGHGMARPATAWHGEARHDMAATGHREAGRRCRGGWVRGGWEWWRSAAKVRWALGTRVDHVH